MMEELTPGLHVTDWVDAGALYVINIDSMAVRGIPLLSGLGGGPRCIVIADADWQKIPPARREQLLSRFTSLSALNGIHTMSQWLHQRVLR